MTHDPQAVPCRRCGCHGNMSCGHEPVDKERLCTLDHGEVCACCYKKEQRYDSRDDTVKHILRVRELLYTVQGKLESRGFAHDQSKLGIVEKPIYDKVTPRLRGLTYGSDQYKAQLKELGEALAHHYANNTHHPEHFANGVAGMSLLDLIEMMCDWKAATERHADGSIENSLTVNRSRFGISDQLQSVLVNTARELGWMK